jgi:DNA helicase II / ATP-dependent DNA helicase PcrA
MYPILIHSAFYRILRESPQGFRARVQKTLLRLRDGNWGGGTQVKRLAGVTHAVFEARIDKGDRLLFTAVRAADRDDPSRLTTHLQVWDVVHHEGVTRRARRNLVSEAEFFDFAALEGFDIAEPPPHPAAPFDEIAPAPEDRLLQFLLPEDHYEPRAIEGIQGGVRWYLAPEFLLADEAEFQQMIDRAEGELELKLMRDQYEILRAPGPLLLAGGAGSGKTTIAVHRLVEARRQMDSGHLLYVSYSPWLVDYAKRLYRDVTLARGADPDHAPPQFATFSDLYRKLVPASHPEPALVTLEAFASWLRQSAPNADASLVWEEVRSILKGACLNLGKAMLDERDYYDLGRKRAPLFANDRPEIFKIGQRYQQWLISSGRMDQVDLCRAAYRETRHGRSARYDTIVCDEVQDLTELEISFVLSLSGSAGLRGVMLTGDTQQIVNPTGFRWADTRQAIAKATGAISVPKPSRLRRNCRSVRPLVELANAILMLKQEIFGRYEDEGPEDAVVEGAAPIQVAANEKQVLEAIRDFGPRCAILVLDEAEGRRLDASLQTTRVFHVREAKGLEFDTVVLWKLISSAGSTVDRFMRSSSGMDHDARFKHFLQHLYVAATRARRHLAIYEGPDPHPFWNSRTLRGRIDVDSVETLGRLFRDSASAKEWAKEGQYYLDRQRYRQAAECYRRAGMADRETAAMAMYAESQEKWQDALSLWQKAGIPDRTGPLLEKLGRLTEALAAYRESGRDEDIARVDLLVLEKEGRWAEAAQRWEASGNAAEAARCHKRAGNKNRALKLEAESAESQRNWKHAAECWFLLKDFENAARCSRKVKDIRGAALAMAHHHEHAKDWRKAASAYQRAGDRTKTQECKALALEMAGDSVKAAKIYERLGQTDRAMQLYRKAGHQEALDNHAVEHADVRQSQTKTVRSLIDRGNFRAALTLAKRRHLVVHNRLNSVKWSISERTDEQFLDERDELEDLILECQANLAEQRRSWAKAARLWRRLQRADRAEAASAKAIESMQDPFERGFALLQTGNPERAIEVFEAAGLTEWTTRARACRCQIEQRWMEAADLWQELGDHKQRAAAMAQHARSIGKWAEAAGWHHLAGQRTLEKQAAAKARRECLAELAPNRTQQTELF